MEAYRIGEIIREERIRKRISQEELCFGICSVATLSRIENSAQNPSFKVREALLERLGHSTENLVIYAEDNEIRKHRLEDEIRAGIVHWQEIDGLLERYGELIAVRGTEDRLEEQFYKMAEAIQAFYTKAWEWERIREQLTEALQITMPGYQPGQIEGIRLLTATELQILNNIALTYAKEEENEKAIHILQFLVYYLEKDRLNVESPGKYYPVLLYNLVVILDRENRFKEIKRYTERGIAYCVGQSRLTCLAEHLFYRAKASHRLGEPVAAETFYRRSMSLFETLGRTAEAQMVQGRLSGLNSAMDEGKVVLAVIPAGQEN